MMAACTNNVPSSTKNLSLEEYKPFGERNFTVNSVQVRQVIDSMVRNDRDGLTADFRTKRHYLQERTFLWVDRCGVTPQADTLLHYLQQIETMGFSPKRFCVSQIEDGIRRVRNLDFDEKHRASKVLGKLEYQLTKAYLRYTSGQRFGYMNPSFIFNQIDTLEPAKTGTAQTATRYRGLFDIKMDHAEKSFYEAAIRKIQNDSVAYFLKEVQPQGNFYRALAEEYANRKGPKSWREKVFCNMERSRWRLADYPQAHRRYVLVNIPSFHLMAVDESDTLTMRIGCGSYKTKTPLLTSEIKRIDVNPKWIVPRSIVEKDMIHYFSRSYCKKKGFYVMDRQTGEEVDMNLVHRGMLTNPQYAVVQRGGKGNSLGRLIFRFDNNFAVYLHDTSSRDVFSRQDRGVSHGCVRVEKPYELARFILKDKDEKFLDDLKYCVTADSLNDKSRIIGSLEVTPQVPVYLTYFTIYPMADKQRAGWAEYPDVYGYDKVIYDFLVKNYR